MIARQINGHGQYSHPILNAGILITTTIGLRKGESWSFDHLIIPPVASGIHQLDGNATPSSLTPDSSLPQSEADKRPNSCSSQDYDDPDKICVDEDYIDEDYEDQTSICGRAENEHCFNHFWSEINGELSAEAVKNELELCGTLSLNLPADGVLVPNRVYKFENLPSRPRVLSASDPQLHLHQDHRHTSAWHRKYRRIKDWMGRLNPFKKRN